MDQFLTEYKASVDYVTESAVDASQLVEEFGIMPKALIAELAIPNCNIIFLEGDSMKTTMQANLNVLFKRTQNPSEEQCLVMTSTTAVDRRPRFPLLKKARRSFFGSPCGKLYRYAWGRSFWFPPPRRFWSAFCSFCGRRTFGLFLPLLFCGSCRLSGSCGSGRFSGCADECIILSTCTG